MLCNDGFPDEEERALRVVPVRERVLAATVELSGDHDEARAWFHEHRITELDNKTAERLVLERTGRAGPEVHRDAERGIPWMALNETEK